MSYDFSTDAEKQIRSENGQTVPVISLSNTGGTSTQYVTTGSPLSVVTGAIGDIAFDISNADLYIDTTAGNTGWKKFAFGGANSNITSLSGLTTPLSIAQGGTGSTTQNWVDLTTAQSVGGIKTFTSQVNVTSNTVKVTRGSTNNSTFETYVTGDTVPRSKFDSTGNVYLKGNGSATAYRIGFDKNGDADYLGITNSKLTSGGANVAICVLDSNTQSDTIEAESTYTIRVGVTGGSKFIDYFNNKYTASQFVGSYITKTSGVTADYDDHVFGYYDAPDTFPALTTTNNERFWRISSTNATGTTSTRNRGQMKIRPTSGTDKATANFHLGAGSATAGTAPLKIDSGTLMTTPETGAIEFDGTHFYGSISSTRYQLDQQATGANSTITSLTGLTTPLSIAQGGTGSATQNFVDLTTAQTVAGVKRFTSVAEFGTSSSVTGGIKFYNSSNAFTQTLQGGVASVDLTFKLPTTGSIAGVQAITCDTSEQMAYKTVPYLHENSGTITVGNAAAGSGTSTATAIGAGAIEASGQKYINYEVDISFSSTAGTKTITAQLTDGTNNIALLSTGFTTTATSQTGKLFIQAHRRTVSTVTYTCWMIIGQGLTTSALTRFNAITTGVTYDWTATSTLSTTVAATTANEAIIKAYSIYIS